MIQIHPIPAFSDNYIWTIIDWDRWHMAVVDPGDAGPVIEYAEDEGLQLVNVLITHHHPDHIGGLGRLIEQYDPVVYGPEPSNIKGITHFLHEGDRIALFDRNYEIFEVPGHTLDHIAYYSADDPQPWLFCGDTLFAAGCGRLFEGTPQMMAGSLDKLRKLNPQTAVYCTHEYTMANLRFALAADGGNAELQDRIGREQQKRDAGEPTLPSTIALELATNPFLRCHDAGVQQAVSNHSGLTSSDPVEVFAALRNWKDIF